MFSFSLDSLTKDVTKRPKYRELLKHPFILRYEEKQVDVGSWLKRILAQAPLNFDKLELWCLFTTIFAEMKCKYFFKKMKCTCMAVCREWHLLVWINRNCFSLASIAGSRTFFNLLVSHENKFEFSVVLQYLVIGVDV